VVLKPWTKETYCHGNGIKIDFWITKRAGMKGALLDNEKGGNFPLIPYRIATYNERF
jgi:hypothetical protein